MDSKSRNASHVGELRHSFEDKNAFSRCEEVKTSLLFSLVTFILFIHILFVLALSYPLFAGEESCKLREGIEGSLSTSGQVMSSVLFWVLHTSERDTLSI